MCVCASLRRLNVKGCPTCTSATWRDQRAPFFVLRISIAVVGPAGRWVPERGGGSDAGGRRAGATHARTAGRRPWPTLTCDADRYGDACRDCHVCAVHERKRPSRMREWQWAETVNRTEKGGATRAPFGKTRPFDKTRPGRRARPEPDMGISDLIGSISELRSGIPGPGAAPGVFIIQQCARGGWCAGTSYCAVLL